MCSTNGIFCLLCLLCLGLFFILGNYIQTTQVIFKDDNAKIVLNDGFDIKNIGSNVVLMQTGKIMWILDNHNNNTQIVRKLAYLFEFTDVVPKSYDIQYYNGTTFLNNSAIKFVNFGNSGIKFIDKLKSESGSLKLSLVIEGLKTKQEIDEFLRKCDTLSFQRMILFMVLIGYGDITPNNIILQYSQDINKIQFVLIDYDDIFHYNKPINKKLLNATDRLSIKLLAKLDCQLPKITEAINNIRALKGRAKRVLNKHVYELFEESFSNFLGNYGMEKFEEYINK